MRTALSVIRWVVVIGVGTALPARASLVELSSTFSGGLYADGSHTPGFMNYYTGYAFPSSPVERRNWFVFDLTGVTDPIVSAKLKLYMPGSPFFPCGYVSSDPTEDYKVTGSPFPWTAFADAFAGVPTPPPTIAAMFGTLGTSTPFGVTTLSGDACGTDVVIDISPEGLMALNMAVGDHIAMGGRLTDLHPGTPGMPPAELGFAYSDIPDPHMPLPRLELELLPEPASIVAGLALAALVLRRR